MSDEINGYALSRNWFDFCFENPEKINPGHSAIYFFAMEHCNRLGWKEKFGFPTQMAMDAIGIKKHQTYIKYFNDLVEWGFFKLIEKSRNQYSANIISLKYAMPKNGKALGKAMVKHAAKHGSGNGQSKDSIDKPLTIEPLTIETSRIISLGTSGDNVPMFKLKSPYAGGTHYIVYGADGYKELIAIEGLTVPKNEETYLIRFMKEKNGSLYEGGIDYIINSFKFYINSLFKNG